MVATQPTKKAPPRSTRAYLRTNVYEEALKRIRWIFETFETVIVNVSGGKDSTVVYHLSMQVATEMNKLPLKILFVDQEAEWQSVVDYMRVLMNDPRVEPYWLQMPIRLSNATSQDEPWLYCWEEGKEWIRPKESNSIHENVYGTKTFGDVFGAFSKYHYRDSTVCNIGGVRCEESPARRLGLTMYETYGGETWGKKRDVKLGHYDFYPLYDWSYTDIWKSIHDNGWEYCKLYDYLYQYGIPVRDMRVSNIHHETAVENLFFLQEIEADTWNRATKRLSGISTAGHLQEQWKIPAELPYMFKDWWEYRDYLLEVMITKPDIQAKYRKLFESYDRRFTEEAQAALVKVEISTLLFNDYHGVKLNGFTASNMQHLKGRGSRSGRRTEGY